MARIAARPTERPISSPDGPPKSDFCSLSKYEGVVNVHAQISYGVFDFRVSEQDLDCSQITSCMVDHCRLGAPKRVCSIFRSS